MVLPSSPCPGAVYGARATERFAAAVADAEHGPRGGAGADRGGRALRGAHEEAASDDGQGQGSGEGGGQGSGHWARREHEEAILSGASLVLLGFSVAVSLYSVKVMGTAGAEALNGAGENAGGSTASSIGGGTGSIGGGNSSDDGGIVIESALRGAGTAGPWRK